VQVAVPVPSTLETGRLREGFDIEPQPARPLELAAVKPKRTDALPDSRKSVRLTLKAMRIEGSIMLR